MKYLGVDGLELCNKTEMGFKDWELAVCTTVSTLDKIHKKGMFHGDIKLENMTFDGKNWNFIDFGFAEIPGNHHFCGTFPYALPAYGGLPSEQIYETTDDIRRASDMFSLALSLLSIAGIYHDEVCDICKHKEVACTVCYGKNVGSRLDIRKYSLVHKDTGIIFGSNWKKLGVIIRPLIEMIIELILTQVDQSKRFLIWQGTCCEYFGENDSFSELYYTKIDDVWCQLIQLTKLISKK